MLAMQRGVRSMGTRLGSPPPGYRRSSSLFLMSMTDPLSTNRLAPAPARAHHLVPFHGVMHRHLSSAPGAANVQVTFSNSGESGNVDSDPPADGDEGGDTQHRVRSDQEIEEEILALQSGKVTLLLWCFFPHRTHTTLRCICVVIG
ncbi:hypothetical protein THAOC_13402 [Thalassiosira oceanica]|uniref:Uncharacterized protein n=1 Tax=Thalassiosira oceanica TaxID=159749 RepID=K0SKA3_THAOC|nr:hypothetical protein THAOC_13402 [Thalassiosira oceanica]|eukprot:EJK65715.1 hypothetical protein THAOC_13402 [Thalassiosira oceanica]